MTYPTIQRYPDPGGSAVAADSSSGLCLDSTVGAQIFVKSDGSTSTAGLRAFDISSSSQNAEATVVDIYGSASPNRIASPMVITPNGQLVIIGQGWLNGSSQFSLLNKTTFAIVDAWNDTNAGGFIPSLPYAPGTPTSFGVTSKSAVSYISAAVAFILGGTVNILEAGPTLMQFAGHTFDVDESRAVTSGSSSGVGKLYTIGYDAGPTTTPCGLYVTTISNGANGYNNASWPGSPNAFIATSKVGTIAPADVDATWTHFNRITQTGYDQSDNKLLWFASTADAVTNKYYLVKLDPADASVVWARPVTDINETFFAMGASNIAGGDYKFIADTGQNLYAIDTSDGSATYTTLSVPTGVGAVNSIYDYTTNSVFFYGGWSSAATPPYPVGGISPSVTTYWYRFQAGAPPTPPIPPGSNGRKFIAVLGPVRVYS